MRRRGLAIGLAATLVLGLGVAEAISASAAVGRLEHKLLRILNTTRARHDLRLLKLDRSLSRSSETHTRLMLRKDALFDPPDLERILADYDWDDLGADVVGCGNTLKELHRLLMSEPIHRAILLNTKLRKVGLGVVRMDERNRCGRDSFWATEILYG